MTDISFQQSIEGSAGTGLRLASLRLPVLVFLTLLAAGLAVYIGLTFRNLADDDPLFISSTVGELAVWMAGQSAEEAPASLLGQYAKNWAMQIGTESLPETVLFNAMRNGMMVWCGLVGVLGLAGVVGLLTRATWTRAVLVLALVGFDALLFIIPAQDGGLLALVLLGIVLLLVILLLSPGRVTQVLGFVVALSALLVMWQGAKAFAYSVNYSITLPLGAWSYETYPSLDDSLAALTAGDIEAVIYDKNELETLVPAFPEANDEADDLPYPDLRLLTRLPTHESQLGLPVRPSFSGRLGVAVRGADVERWTGISDFTNQHVGTIAGEFAEERYLAVPRELVLVDLKIFNDLNLPHLQSIARAYTQPARRNGPLLLVRILGDAGLYTWGEALFGFVFGASLGFVLGTLFAHSRLMERGLLPYVVASQTVPILAIAPMVVIWLGAGQLAVAVIAAYITFFPVTINTLRGLRSPTPMALELMQSYAASKWDVMWKLRFPAALPYIFTALKVSATASVVGAVIGELPSSIRDGLGRAILDFSSDYSPVSTPKLWAAIIMAALVGITFFLIVSFVERIVLRRYVREA